MEPLTGSSQAVAEKKADPRLERVDHYGLPDNAKIDAELDAAFDKTIATRPRDEKGQFSEGVKPTKAQEEQPEEEPQDAETPPGEDEADEKPAASEGAPTKAKATPEQREAAIKALRLLPGGLPDGVVEGLSDEQLLAWGAKAKDAQTKTAEKLQSQAEALKAQGTKPETTAPQAEQPSEPDLETALQAFKDYDEDFKKGQLELSRATVRTVVKVLMNDLQPAVKEQAESSKIVRSMARREMRREFDGMFPELVDADQQFSRVTAKYTQLWGPEGATYQDAAPDPLDRMLVCFRDACKIEVAAPQHRKDSRRQANGLMSPPARQAPKQALTDEDELDKAVEESLARFR